MSVSNDSIYFYVDYVEDTLDPGWSLIIGSLVSHDDDNDGDDDDDDGRNVCADCGVIKLSHSWIPPPSAS
jgi:hypothetical protein